MRVTARQRNGQRAESKESSTCNFLDNSVLNVLKKRKMCTVRICVSEQILRRCQALCCGRSTFRLITPPVASPIGAVNLTEALRQG